MFNNLFRKFSNTLYYPGCLTKFVLPDIYNNYIKILNKMNVDFILLKEFEYCCGSPVINAGYKDDYEKIKRRNLEVFRNHSVGKIITSCPACYNRLKEYKLDVEHITSVIVRNLDKFQAIYGEEITYFDPCHLGRYANIYEEPREILRKVGFRVVDLENNREKSLCCGGGGGVKGNLPTLSNKIAKLILNQVKTKKIITACPMCYVHLKENAKNTGIEVYELSQVLV